MIKKYIYPKCVIALLLIHYVSYNSASELNAIEMMLPTEIMMSFTGHEERIAVNKRYTSFSFLRALLKTAQGAKKSKQKQNDRDPMVNRIILLFGR